MTTSCNTLAEDLRLELTRLEQHYDDLDNVYIGPKLPGPNETPPSPDSGCGRRFGHEHEL
eukprot:12883507-Prorocentrum_lima.AAC.1